MFAMEGSINPWERKRTVFYDDPDLDEKTLARVTRVHKPLYEAKPKKRPPETWVTMQGKPGKDGMFSLEVRKEIAEYAVEKGSRAAAIKWGVKTDYVHSQMRKLRDGRLG